MKAQFNEVEQCAQYVDLGATATDNVDESGQLTQRIITAVEGEKEWPPSTRTPRTFRVVYDVSDSSGNRAQQKSRRVRVVAVEGATC